MNIGFIGAGKVGFTLGKYINERKHCVSGYYSQNYDSAKQAAKFIQTNAYETLEDIIQSSDVLFLTVPDSAIATIWDLLLGFNLQGKCICHCSGAHASSIFSNITEAGAYGYSIHPLYAISDKYQSYKELQHAFFTIEGHPKYLSYFKQFFEELGNSVGIIEAKSKPLYHSAAVFSSNLVIALFHQTIELLKQCGLSKDDAMKAIQPIYLGNVHKMLEVGPVRALTGPVERNDVNTIKKHLDVLDERSQDIYCMLSRILIDIAREKNQENDYSKLIQILERNGQ